MIRSHTPRNAALDILKLALAIMVVGIHSKVFQDSSPTLSHILVNGIFRVAVPTFFIINGYYFYNVIQGDGIKLWLGRLASLYAFWMLVYSPFWAVPGEGGFNVLQVLYNVVFGYHHLWYIAGLGGAGTFLYVTRNLSQKAQCTLSVLTFLTGVAIQYAGALDLFTGALDKVLDKNVAHRNFLFLAYPFMFAGMALRTLDIHRFAKDLYVAIAMIAGSMLLLAESTRNAMRLGATNFDNLFSLLIICPALFVAFIKAGGDWDSRTLSKASSGIYFAHPLFLFFFTSHPTTSAFLLALILSAFSSILLIKLSNRLRFVL